MSGFRAVVLDMDGLMLDTERIAVECWLESARVSGWEISRETLLAMIGLDHRASRQKLLDAGGSSFPLDEVSKRGRGRYLERLRGEGVGLKPGIVELLDWLDARGVPKAVATSTMGELAMEKLELAGLRGRFETIVCGDQVPKTKPAPDVYLAAVGQLGLAPGACIALEDSDIGLRAAHGAGLACIVVPDLQPPRDEYAGLAHRVVASLAEARAVIEELLQSGR
ncbi:MAG: HAD family phosphatase [Burkholderiaceae bacterium]|nr:HAD family phosphatase [Burkholderiaceae bacterium]